MKAIKPSHQGINWVLGILIILGIVLSYAWVLPPEIPLWVNLPRTPDQLAAKEWIFLFAIFIGISLVVTELLRRSVQVIEAKKFVVWFNSFTLFILVLCCIRILSAVL